MSDTGVGKCAPALVSGELSRQSDENLVTKNVSANLTVSSEQIDGKVNNDNRIFVTVELSGVSYNALIDTGSSESYISDKVADTVGKHCTKRSWEGGYVRLADGTLVPVNTSFGVNLQFNDKLINCNMKVIKDLTVDVLIGLDLLSELFPDITDWFGSQPLQVDNTNNVLNLSAIEKLTSEQNKRLKEFLDYELALFDKVPGRTNLATHVIRPKPDIVPVKQRYYPLSPAMKTVLHKEIDDMIENDIIEPSDSPWNSPLCLVKKPSGKFRVTLDMRVVNKSTISDAYGIPWISSILDKLRKAKYISTLDMKNGYWQVPLHPESRQYTAFTVPGRGFFQFKVMAFGLHSAPATFQRLLDKVIGADLDEVAFPYLDDIILVSESFDEHLKLLKEVFRRLRDAGLKLNIKKCRFCQLELIYLGHRVSNKGIGTDPEKVQAIVSYPPPKNIKELRRFYGMASWYRRFVQNFSDIAQPLTQLLKKNMKWEWGTEQDNAMKELKRRLTEAPILVCPDFSLPFTIKSDASGSGIGSILCQWQNGEERVIAYNSRALSDVEKRYSACEKECLAVVHAIRKYRQYIEGQHFTVLTDCLALKWLNSMKNPSGRLAKWSLELQQFDYEIKYNKGSLNIVPDALSRIPEVSCVQETVKCEWYDPLIKSVFDNPDKYPDFKIDQGELFKKVKFYKDKVEDNMWKLCVRKPERNRVLQECHSTPTAGHLGREKTTARAADQYFWPGMQREVRDFVQQCESCQRHKVEQRQTSGTMGIRPTAGVWQEITTDLIGPLPRSSKGNCYLLLFQDRFTKWVEYATLRRATANTVGEAFKNLVVYRHGVPQSVLCDNGSQYDSKFFKDLAKEYMFTIKFTPPYTPQANPVERTNRTIKTIIRQFCENDHRKWDHYIAEIVFAWNTARNSTTGFSPAYLNFGREIPQPKSLKWERFDSNDPCAITVPDHVERLEAALNQVRDIAIENTRRASQTQKRYYDLRRRPLEFNVGDKVFKKNYVLSSAPKHFSASLAQRFTGPFRVKRKISPRVYELVNENNKTIGTWHVKDLKMCH